MLGDMNRPFVTRFLAFEEFITVKFIRIIFIVGLAFSLLYATLMALGVAYQSYIYIHYEMVGLGLLTFFGGLLAVFLITILGMVFWRMYCELIVVIFKIAENLQYIRDVKAGDPPRVP